MSLEPSSKKSPNDFTAPERMVWFDDTLVTHTKDANLSNQPPASGRKNQTPEMLSPLEAALVVKSRHIETLHELLKPYLSNLADQCLKAYVTYFHKNAKLTDMSLANDYVPTSVKHVRLTLQALEEVRESEGYKALHRQLAVKTKTIQCKWTQDFVLKVDEMNCQALLRHFQLAYCRYLPLAANRFMAQFGIDETHDKHRVILDLLAKHTQVIVTPVSLSIGTYLETYKSANELKIRWLRDMGS
jgi:hypothetical protein